jgi:hypothetical protein
MAKKVFTGPLSGQAYTNNGGALCMQNPIVKNIFVGPNFSNSVSMLLLFAYFDTDP